MSLNIWGSEPSKRKNFSPATQKAALLKSHEKCMNCKEKLDPRATELDHKNNNPSDNSLKNCFVVCSNCHRKHTVITKEKVKDGWGNVVGYKTVKHKVGYKKEKKTVKRIPIRDFLGNITGYKTVKVRAKKKSKSNKTKKQKTRHKSRSIWDIPIGF